VTNVLKHGVLTTIRMGMDTCTITAKSFDKEGRLVDDLVLTIHIPPDLVAMHMAIQRMGGEYEKDAAKTAFYEALERLFGKKTP
jgi:hypothetical protein